MPQNRFCLIAAPVYFESFIACGILERSDEMIVIFVTSMFSNLLTEMARKIADEAKCKGMWLYDPSYKKWYSPEDFKHIFHFDNAKDEFLKKLQLRHPLEGIKAGFQRLMDIHNKLQTFINLVINYYKK